MFISEQLSHSSHFALFGLNPTFTLDEQRLTARYYELQRRFHPDRFISGSDSEPKDMAQQVLQQSAVINEAYHTLKDPLLRAEYLISLHCSNQSPDHARQRALHDPAFLEEQLTLREALAKVTNRSSLVKIAADIRAFYADLHRQLTQALNQDKWEQAAHVLDKLKFLVKLQQQISQLEVTLPAD